MNMLMNPMSAVAAHVREAESNSIATSTREANQTQNEEPPPPANQEHEQVERFCRQYQQRLDLKTLSWPSPCTLQNATMQGRIWTAIDAMQLTRPYPAYDRRILKELMARIEDAVKDMDDPEILDSFAELSAELFVTPTPTVTSSLLPTTAPAEDAYILAHYTVPWLSPSLTSTLPPAAAPNCTIDILENPRVLAAAGCTGHRTWEAALRLASLLGYSPYLKCLLKDAHVLELGAGTGLVSFAAAMLPDGPISVRATDGDAGAVERLKRTEQRWWSEQTEQHKRCVVQCEVLLWGDLDDPREARAGAAEEHVDIVLAADVTYDPAGIPDLVGTLQALLDKNPQTVIIIAATMRNADTLAVFEGECDAKRLGIERLSEARLGVGVELQSVGIGGVSKADVTRQMGFFHAPAAEIVIMQVSLLADDAVHQ